MSRLAIIIVSYNTREYLERCLASLREHPPRAPHEIVVVDNASADGSVELVRQKFPEVRLIVNRFNYGFAVGNNQGLRATTAPYVMSLNPDTEYEPGAVDRLVEFLDAHPQAGLAAPVVVHADGSVVPPPNELHLFAGSVLLDAARARLLPARPTQTRLGEAPFEVAWVWGTGYICRRAALWPDRFFDEDLFLFGEEYGLIEKLRAGGYHAFVVPAARMRHHISVSFRRRSDSLQAVRRLYIAAQWDLRRKVFGAAPAALSQAVQALDYLVLWAAIAAKKRLAGESPQRTLAEVDYRTRALASLRVIVEGDRYLAKVNASTRRFLNQGVDPPMPPVTV